MSPRMLRRPGIRNAFVVLGVVSITALGLTAPAAADAERISTPTIDTYTGWDGVGYVHEFGHPNSATYGQVITAPAGLTKLRWFTFYVAADVGTGTLRFRGEVYGWNGSMATEEVWESKRKDRDFTAGDPEFYPVKVKSRGATLVPGQQYVIFLTVSKDYESTDPGLQTRWAARFSDALPGGDAVFINNGGAESMWTTSPWGILTGSDFAMKAKLR